MRDIVVAYERHSYSILET